MSTDYSFLTRNIRPSRRPLVRGAGLNVVDVDGRTLFDFGAQTSNLAVGQSHPEVVDAVTEQMRHLVYASSSFSNTPFLELARRLVELAPAGLTATNLRMCNGSDAVETALKTARLYKWSPKVLHVTGAWHGESIGTLAFTPSCRDSLLTTDRNLVASEAPTLGSLAELIVRNPDAAAVIVDPVGVSNGLFARSDIAENLPRIRELCTAHDIVLIYDEVQTFGFMGGSLFATDTLGVTPDIICIAKALAGGLPLAGVLCRTELAELLSHNEAEFTNGGTPVTSAAAVAFLDVYSRERDTFQRNVEAFGAAMADLAARCPFLDHDVYGFIASFRLRPDRFREPWAARAVSLAGAAGIILRTSNFGQDVFIKPSIVIEPDVSARQADRLVAVFQEAAGATADIGVDPTTLRSGLTVHRPEPAVDAPAYFRALLQAVDPTSSVRTRSAEEIETLTRRLPRTGVFVNRAFASPDGDLRHEPMSGATLAQHLAAGVTGAALNGLVSQHQRYLESAHAHDIVIGGRWCRSAVTDGGGSVRLIDFGLAYSGHFETLAAFEELFALFDLAAHIADADLRVALLRRIAPGVFRRWPRESPAVWLGIRKTHLDGSPVGRPTGPDVYPDLARVLDRIASGV